MEQDKKKKLRKGFKIAGITVGSVLGVAVLSLSTYVIYVFAQYSRIKDNQILKINHIENCEKVPMNQELAYTSFNIGFGAYSYDYTFFLDKGFSDDGELQHGYWSKGKSKEESLRNTYGCINYLKQLDSDFIAIQEVDTDSDRCHHINQEEKILEQLDKYEENFACNFHSAYLAYPLYDPHGASIAGLQTMSKYKMDSAIRKSYPLSDNIMDKLFDLDRCFSATYIDIDASDKQLVLINSHMSAYDEGGVIRNEQIKVLNSFMLQEYNKGNYVIAGGDFNHDLLTNNPDYDYDVGKHPYQDIHTQQRPPWVTSMFDENKNDKFDDHFKIIAADNTPTCRGVDIPYEYGKTYCSTVDGFLISDNVEFIDVKTTDVKSDMSPLFSYSDHQPTTLKFKLK